MQDPIEKMKLAFEDAEANSKLMKFAQKCEQDQVEKALEQFISAAVKPAFAKVDREFFRAKKLVLQELPEQPFYPGFKVQDFPETQFLFWINLQGRLPKPEALRKFGNLKLPGAFGVATYFLTSKPGLGLKNITEDVIVRAIAEAYMKSLQFNYFHGRH